MLKYKIGDLVKLTNGYITRITDYASGMSGEEGYIGDEQSLITPEMIICKIEE